MNATTNNKKRNDVLDAVKGCLILFIVLEHNALLTSQYHWIRPVCDAFAAGTFLLFTFIWPIKQITFNQLLNKTLAYCWPFILLVSALAVVNSLLLHAYTHSELPKYLTQAFILTSPFAIKQASGFMYLWFLPCLALLYLIRFFAEQARTFSLVITLFMYATIGFIDEELLIKTPFSLHVIIFILPLGLIYQTFHTKLISATQTLKFTLIMSFIILLACAPVIGWQLFLAGGIFPNIQQPLLLMYYALMHFIAIPALYFLCKSVPKLLQQLLVFLGNQSLIIYLVHPIIYIGLTELTQFITHGWIALLITILLSAVVALLLNSFPRLKLLLFPKKISDLAQLTLSKRAN